MENFICMLCEMKKYPIEKVLDEDSILERKNEFYPDEEFGNYSGVCESCHQELLEYYLNK